MAAPRSPADRQRDRRRRRARGRVVIPIEIDLVETADVLVEKRLLQEWDSEDRGKVAEAIAKVIQIMVRHA